MGVRVVFIMNFVVGWVVLATVWSSIDAGRLETDGWQEMAVATFLVGCSALMFEEWLCRKRPLRLKTRAFLLRSALLHAVYMALAFELNRMMTLLHGVYLMHGFAHGSLITAVLRWLQALVFTLPFSMAFTAPAGVLVGLANGLLLRAREADASASSRRLAQILVGLVILLVTVAGLQLVHGWRVKVRTLAAAQRALHELPMPPRTALVYREYKGCIPCRDARVTAVYATDLSPEEVCEAYRSHLSRPGWDPSPDGCQGRHVSGGVESARFHVGATRSCNNVE